MRCNDKNLKMKKKQIMSKREVFIFLLALIAGGLFCTIINAIRNRELVFWKELLICAVVGAIFGVITGLPLHFILKKGQKDKEDIVN
jgi:membrane associated rhomboid family serine protease